MSKKSTLQKRKILVTSKSLKLYFDAIYANDRLCDSIPQKELTELFENRKKNKDRILKTCLRFVVRVAEQYQSCGVPIEDLISVGNIGLINAFYKYDHQRSPKFLSYAVWHIRQQIIETIRYQKDVPYTIPRQDVEGYKKIANVLHNSDKWVSENDIQKATGLGIAAIRRIYTIIRKHDSFVSIGDANGRQKDSKQTDHNAMHKDLQDSIAQALQVLTEKEKKVIIKYYQLDYEGVETDFKTIGIEMGLSLERIRQLHVQAIEKLRRKRIKKLLKVYL
jgi:RNA polymerase primary sigma factor